MGHCSSLTSFAEKGCLSLNKQLNLHKPLGLAMRKHPVSIALSNSVLEKIDKEALKQKRSRSDFIEVHFEAMFSEEELKKK